MKSLLERVTWDIICCHEGRTITMAARNSLASWAVMVLLFAPVLHGQSLAPRAYVVTPVGSNAITITSDFSTGGIEFSDSVPITGGHGKIAVVVPSYYRALNFFGRSANIAVGVPYALGRFNALVVDQEQSVRRSGLGDGAVRFSVNLTGAPAMKVPQFLKWKQKRLLGASLLVQFPSGQYDPTKLINIGANRWGFKPEVGFSGRRGNWVFDVYGGVWIFTTNPEFFCHNSYFSGTRYQNQEPIGATEVHLSRDFGKGTWVSADANFWYGGKTSLNGVESPDTLQKNSRVGATAAFRVSKHQSLKLSYARGAYIRLGGNYQTVAVAWQYAWIGASKMK